MRAGGDVERDLALSCHCTVRHSTAGHPDLEERLSLLPGLAVQ